MAARPPRTTSIAPERVAGALHERVNSWLAEVFAASADPVPVPARGQAPEDAARLEPVGTSLALDAVTFGLGGTAPTRSVLCTP